MYALNLKNNMTYNKYNNNYFFIGLCKCTPATLTMLTQHPKILHLTLLTVQNPLQTYDLQVSGLKHDVGYCSEINKADILVYQLTF